MINTSNEYDNRIMEDRRFVLSADLTFPDNTKILLNDSDIMQGGMEFEDAVSSNSSFQIGAAIINKHTLTIQNYDGKFDAYDFEGATLIPYVGLQLSETIESLKKGFYTVDDSKALGSLLVLECLDNMHKFERPFKGVNIAFPTTAINLLQTVCTHCGVFLNTASFTNSNFTIKERPADEALSCLDIVSYIAQIAGCFARCNINGALELKWYDLTAFEGGDSLDGGQFDNSIPYSTGDSADGGNFIDYNSGSSVEGGTFLQTKKYWHLYDFGSTPTVAVDDVVITGIKIENTANENDFTTMFGYDGYILTITNNPLIQNQSASNTIANSVGSKIVGMRFRIFSASCLSNPAIEAGDPAYVSVRTNKGYNSYQSFITNLSYKIGSREQISCNAETPSRNSSTRYSAETKAIVKAREQTKQQLTEFDLAVQQLNSVMANAMGYYPIREEQADGSYIDYMADKPTLEESQIIWKKSINGFAISIDGGQTWTSGMTADGNIIAKTLSVIGINAEWIKVLTSFTVGNNFSVDALGKLIASNADITGKITARSGQIGRLTISNDGLKSNAMELLDDDVNPLIWLKSADDSESANYEGALAYLRHSNNGKRQTALLDTRPSWVHGMELTKENIENNGDIQGEVYERVKYTADGITKISEVPSTYVMNILGHSVFFGDDAIYITEKNGNFISLNKYGFQILSADNGSVSSMGNGLQLSHPSGVYANGRNITVAPQELNALNNTVQELNYDIQNIKRYLNI